MWRLMSTLLITACVLQRASTKCSKPHQNGTKQGYINYSGRNREDCTWNITGNPEEQALILRLSNFSLLHPLSTTTCLAYVKLPEIPKFCHPTYDCVIYALSSSALDATVYAKCKTVILFLREELPNLIKLEKRYISAKSFRVDYFFVGHKKAKEAATTEFNRISGANTSLEIERQNTTQTHTEPFSRVGVFAAIACVFFVLLVCCVIVIAWMYRRYKKLSLQSHALEYSARALRSTLTATQRRNHVHENPGYVAYNQPSNQPYAEFVGAADCSFEANRYSSEFDEDDNDATQQNVSTPPNNHDATNVLGEHAHDETAGDTERGQAAAQGNSESIRNRVEPTPSSVVYGSVMKKKSERI